MLNAFASNTLAMTGPIRRETESAASARAIERVEERLKRVQERERAVVELQASLRSSRTELSVRQGAVSAAEARIDARERALTALEERLRPTSPSLTSSLDSAVRPAMSINGGRQGGGSGSRGNIQARERELEAWSKALGEQASAMKEQALMLETAFDQLREREARGHDAPGDAEDRDGNDRVEESREEKVPPREQTVEDDGRQQRILATPIAAATEHEVTAAPTSTPTVTAARAPAANPGWEMSGGEASRQRELEQETVRLAEKARELDAERRRLAVAAETAERDQSRAQRERKEASEARKDAAKLRLELERERVRLEAEKGGLAAERSLLAAERGRLATEKARALREESQAVMTGSSGNGRVDPRNVLPSAGTASADDSRGEEVPPRSSPQVTFASRTRLDYEGRESRSAGGPEDGRNPTNLQRPASSKHEVISGAGRPRRSTDTSSAVFHSQSLEASVEDCSERDAGAPRHSSDVVAEPVVLDFASSGPSLESRPHGVTVGLGHPLRAPSAGASAPQQRDEGGSRTVQTLAADLAAESTSEEKKHSSDDPLEEKGLRPAARSLSPVRGHVHGRQESPQNKRTSRKTPRRGVATRSTRPTVESVRRRLHVQRTADDDNRGGSSDSSVDSPPAARASWRRAPAGGASSSSGGSSIPAVRAARSSPSLTGGPGQKKRASRTESSTAPVSAQGMSAVPSIGRVSKFTAAAAAGAIAAREDPFLAQFHARLAGADHIFRQSLGRREALLSRFGHAGSSIGPSEGETSDFPSGSVDVSPETKASDSSSPADALRQRSPTTPANVGSGGTESTGEVVGATAAREDTTEKSRFGFTGGLRTPHRPQREERGQAPAPHVAAVLPEVSLETESATPGRSQRGPASTDPSASRTEQSRKSKSKSAETTRSREGHVPLAREEHGQSARVVAPGKGRDREREAATAASDTDDTEAEKENLRELMLALGAVEDGNPNASERSLYGQEGKEEVSVNPVYRPWSQDGRRDTVEEGKRSHDSSPRGSPSGNTQTGDEAAGEADAGGGNTLMSSVRAQNEVIVSRLYDMSLQVRSLSRFSRRFAL